MNSLNARLVQLIAMMQRSISLGSAAAADGRAGRTTVQHCQRRHRFMLLDQTVQCCAIIKLLSSLRRGVAALNSMVKMLSEYFRSKWAIIIQSL